MNNWRTPKLIVAILVNIVVFSLFITPAHATTTSFIVDSEGDVGLFTSQALNSLGFSVISYYDNTNLELKVLVCTTISCTDKIITTVDSDGNVGMHPSLVLNSNNSPVISYLDLTNYDLKIAICADAVCSDITITVVDNTNRVGQYTSLMLNHNGFPVISYYEITNGDLKLAVCADTICAEKTITTVDSADNVGQYTSLRLTDSGFPVISYYDVTNGDLKIVICSDIVCSNKSINTLDSDGDMGRFNSLALNGNIPIISYSDNTEGHLKLATCSDSACTDKIITVVDSGIWSGYYSSLGLNTNGSPLISYYNSFRGDLRLAECSDTACTNKTIAIVDSDGNVGYYTSLAINSSNNPIVSYYDNTNGDLKLAIIVHPTVTNIVRADKNPNGEAFVQFSITFSEPVGWVDPSTMKLVTSGIDGASITNTMVGSTTAERIVTVYTGSGDGTIRLDLNDDDTIADLIGYKLGGIGTGNGDFSAGETYEIDKTSPSVLSITCDSDNPTNASSVDFRITFSEPVTDVDISDLSLITTDITDASIAGVNGTGSIRTITVNTGTGNGTIRLDMNLSAAFWDLAGNFNVIQSYTSGEMYNVIKNSPPIGLYISSASVNEGLPVGITVGTFATTDPDLGDTFIYSFCGGTDDVLFQINENRLLTNAVFNYEENNNYIICIRSSDAGDLYLDRNLSITITNINETPIDLTLSNSISAENQPLGTLIGNLSTTDPDLGDTFAYSFCGGMDDALFHIIGNQLLTNAVFNYEERYDYSICIRTDDSNGGTFDKNFSITVTDANDAPTDITLSSNSVSENRPAGTTVGTLTTTDPDTGDTHTYSFACTVPGANDASFTIAGNLLKTAAAFNYETKKTYSICIRTNDGNGGTFDKNFTISITDLPETFTSIGGYDGWILEFNETSSTGGTLNATDTTFRLGDETEDKQYRSILSFNTAGLPDTAVILKVTLKIKKMAQVGTNPFTFPTVLRVDIRKPFFGTTSNLVITDFQAAVSRAAVGTFGNIPSANWYTAILNGTAYVHINKTGATQFRLYFLKDDNDDGNPDYMKFASGNYATVSSRPTLIVEYYVP